MRAYRNIHHCYGITTYILQRRFDHEEVHYDAALHFDKIRGMTVRDDDV